MTERYLSLGGLLRTGCEVTNLTTEPGRVLRAICHNGESFEADYFVAACDANVLYEGLLEGRYQDRAFRERYQNQKDYDAWDALARDRETYRSEKARIGLEVSLAVETLSASSSMCAF